jgi:hypothetical protein
MNAKVVYEVIPFSGNGRDRYIELQWQGYAARMFAMSDVEQR